MATSYSTTVSPCKYKFNCRNGLSCPLQHTEEEKSFFQKNGGKGNPNRKTRPCENSKCQKKKDCIYAHGEEDAWCLNCISSGHFTDNCNISRPNPKQPTAQQENQEQTVQQLHEEVTEQNLETQQRPIEQQQTDHQHYLKDVITFSSDKLVYIYCNVQVLQNSSVFIRVDESKFPNRTPTPDWRKKVETITKQPSFNFFWVEVHDELETNTLCLVFTPGSDINELMSSIKDNTDDLFIVSSPKNFYTYKIYAEPCRYKFNCKYGLECDFQHTRDEREFFKKNGGKGNPNRKTRPCENSKCQKKKEDCIYAHGEEDAWCLNCILSGHFTDNCQKEVSEPRQQFQETKHQQDQEKKPEMAPKHQDLQHRGEPNAYRADIAYRVMTETDIALKIDSCGIELSTLAEKLCTYKIVNDKQVKSITDDSNGQTNEARMKQLLRKVTDTVREDGKVFGYFLKILRDEDTILTDKFAEHMEEKYEEYFQ